MHDNLDLTHFSPVADPAVHRGMILSGRARFPDFISIHICSVCEMVPGFGSVNEYWPITNPITTATILKMHGDHNYMTRCVNSLSISMIVTVAVDGSTVTPGILGVTAALPSSINPCAVIVKSSGPSNTRSLNTIRSIHGRRLVAGRNSKSP